LKIFLPFKREQNPYLDELEIFSEFDFEYGDLEDYRSHFPIVHIHWPEALFDWHEPSNAQLDKLEKLISMWKTHSKIVYTKHDFRRNKGTTPKFTRLFKIIEQNAHVFIHLGDFSKKKYSINYPEAVHTIIPHPIYTLFPRFDKKTARERLGISGDSFVICAPGNIRSFEERKLLLRTFKKLEVAEKVLIATNMHNEIPVDFKGRVRLKKVFDVREYVVKRFKRKYSIPEYYFTYQNLMQDEFALRVSASDLIFIPRIESLNSGNLLLGLSFEKMVVAPRTGNITEQMEDFGFPIFDPKQISSAVRALEKGISLIEKEYEPESEKIDRLHPQNIAHLMDEFFKNLIYGS
jgi:tetrahydromethanopterin S-methyltransferase subunit B